MALLQQSVTNFANDDDLFDGADNELQPGAAVKATNHEKDCQQNKEELEPASMIQMQTTQSEPPSEESTVHLEGVNYFELYRDKCAEYDELLNAAQNIERAYGKLVAEKNREIVKLRDASSRLYQSDTRKTHEIVRLKILVEQLRRQLNTKHPATLDSISAESSESRSE